MQLGQEDLEYFIAFVLLDEASRLPCGKRQTQPMSGFWMNRQGKLGIRRSDGRLRRAACIEALTTIGKERVEKAAARVAKTLGGLQTAKHIAVIRVDYYETRRTAPDALRLFIPSFVSWRDWVLTADDQTLQFALDRYASAFGRRRRKSLAKLFTAIRNDSIQLDRNRAWILGPAMHLRNQLESREWNLPSELNQKAGKLVELAHLHARAGDVPEATRLLEQALELWRNHGISEPSAIADAIASLQAEIACISIRRQSRGCVLFHRSKREHVEGILHTAFRNDPVDPALPNLRGMRLFERPLDTLGSWGDDVWLEVQVSLQESDLARFEISNPEETHREWCVPAELLNRVAVAVSRSQL
jgi:hypothetical protein